MKRWKVLITLLLLIVSLALVSLNSRNVFSTEGIWETPQIALGGGSSPNGVPPDCQCDDFIGKWKWGT